MSWQHQLQSDPRRRIVVTGASGWLGRNLLAMLAEVIGPEHLADRVALFGSGRRMLSVAPGISLEQHALADMTSLPSQPTAVFHLAFLTKDRADSMDEAQYRAGNLAIREQVLAALDPIGTDQLFVASSGAIYRAEDQTASPAMRTYGALKLADERVFSDWAGASGRRLVISRIFSLSGAYINKPEVYALAAFILDALARRPITIRAERPVYRSYVPVRELLSLAFELLAAEDGTDATFDSGGEPVEMAELATTVLKVLGGAGMARPRFAADAQADHYYGDAAAYRQLLDSASMQPVALEAQVAETANFLVQQGRGVA